MAIHCHASLNDAERLAEEIRIAGGRAVALLGEVGEMFGMHGRDHQHVRGRLRVEIAERDDVRVAEDFDCRDLTAHDLAKDAVWIRVHFLKLIVSK